MLAPAHVIEHIGGVARGARLQAFGIDRHGLARAVRLGSVVRVRAGVFALPHTPHDIVVAAEHGGSVTCMSALRLHGIWALDEASALHVWMGANGRVHHDGCECVSHWYGGATTLGLAPVEDALVHVLRCGGDEAFFAALESALKQRKIRSTAGLRRRIPASARWLIDLAREDADSGLESLLRLRLHLIGLRLDCQVSLSGVGRVDFVVDGRVILEVDGAEHHAGRSARHRDLQRDAAASRLGYETLRFDYAMVMHHWPVVRAAVMAALVRAAR